MNWMICEQPKLATKRSQNAIKTDKIQHITAINRLTTPIERHTGKQGVPEVIILKSKSIRWVKWTRNTFFYDKSTKVVLFIYDMHKYFNKLRLGLEEPGSVNRLQEHLNQKMYRSMVLSSSFGFLFSWAMCNFLGPLRFIAQFQSK